MILSPFGAVYLYYQMQMLWPVIDDGIDRRWRLAYRQVAKKKQPVQRNTLLLGIPEETQAEISVDQQHD